MKAVALYMLAAACAAEAFTAAPVTLTPQRHLRSPAPVLMLENDKAPPEVLEAEAKAMPNRKYRLVGAGTGFGLSLLSGVLSAAVLAGQEDALKLADLVLFDNAIASLAINVVIGSTCAWAFQQELATKEANIERIWQEVKRRRSSPFLKHGRPWSTKHELTHLFVHSFFRSFSRDWNKVRT